MKFSSGKNLTFDVYVPEYSLAFEYQGEQHFYEVYPLGRQQLYAARDEEKKIECKKEGITLIDVPYWWDFSQNTLEATIYCHRPELVPKPTANPIEMKFAYKNKSGTHSVMLQPDNFHEEEVQLIGVLPTGLYCQQ